MSFFNRLFSKKPARTNPQPGGLDEILAALDQSARTNPQPGGSAERLTALDQSARTNPQPGGLDEILAALDQPDRLSDMPVRIELCQQALVMVSRQAKPQLWAALQNQLADRLAQNPLGNRAKNLEQAIQHYQQALAIYTRQAYP